MIMVPWVTTGAAAAPPPFRVPLRPRLCGAANGGSRSAPRRLAGHDAWRSLRSTHRSNAIMVSSSVSSASVSQHTGGGARPVSWGQPLSRGFSADAPPDWARRGGNGTILQKAMRKDQRRPRAAAADAASAGADAGRAKTPKKKGASEEEEEDEEDDSEDEDDENEDFDMGVGNWGEEAKTRKEKGASEEEHEEDDISHWGEKGTDPNIHRQSCIDGRDLHV